MMIQSGARFPKKRNTLKTKSCRMIVDRLAANFTGGQRRIILWY